MLPRRINNREEEEDVDLDSDSDDSDDDSYDDDDSGLLQDGGHLRIYRRDRVRDRHVLSQLDELFNNKAKSSHSSSSSKSNVDRKSKTKITKYNHHRHRYHQALSNTVSLPRLLYYRESAYFSSYHTNVPLKRALIHSLTTGGGKYPLTYHPFYSSHDNLPNEYMIHFQLESVDNQFMSTVTRKELINNGRRQWNLSIMRVQSEDCSEDFFQNFHSPLYCGVIPNSIVGAGGRVRKAMWYPLDTGMIAIITNRNVGLFDCNTTQYINADNNQLAGTETLNNWIARNSNDISCAEWNPIDCNTIALGQRCMGTVRLYDIRTTSSLANLILRPRMQCSSSSYGDITDLQTQNFVTTLCWAPNDQYCLLVGDRNGALHCFDTRQLTRSICYQLPPNHLFFRPVLWMGFSPNGAQLFTTHYRLFITQWNFDPSTTDTSSSSSSSTAQSSSSSFSSSSSSKSSLLSSSSAPSFLHNTNVHFEVDWLKELKCLGRFNAPYTEDSDEDRSALCATQQELLITDRYLYGPVWPSCSMWQPIIACYDRHTGAPVHTGLIADQGHDVKNINVPSITFFRSNHDTIGGHTGTLSNLVAVQGYRRTRFGDDPTPTLVFGGNGRGLYAARMRSFPVEDSDKKMNSKHKKGGKRKKIKRGSRIKRSYLFGPDLLSPSFQQRTPPSMTTTSTTTTNATATSTSLADNWSSDED